MGGGAAIAGTGVVCFYISETGWDWIISCYLSERREVANNETNPND